jgi:Mg-chelatase subunit ChlD
MIETCETCETCEKMDLISKNDSYIIFENQDICEEIVSDLEIMENMENMENMKFGILNLKTNNSIEGDKKVQHIVFSVDCSGSMSDICNDRRSKMDHINHTIINMIMFLVEQPKLVVYLSVFAFDDKIYKIIENELISSNNFEKLINQVKQIRPRNMTNIENALWNSKNYIQNLQKDNYNDEEIKKDITITHIFMTDGDANQGKVIPEELLEIVSDLSMISISNIFVGFGLDHNAYLLKILSSSNKNKYYFIDALEKAGLVYGEILHSIIYKIFENISITIKGGYLYDWKKNIWSNDIVIDDLVSDINKVFHIISKNPSNCEVIIKGNNYLTNKPFESTIMGIVKTDNIDMVNKVGMSVVSDLTKYKYRQRTQKLMFEVNKHNFDKIYILNNFVDENYEKRSKEQIEENILLKTKMNLLLKEMKKYCENLVDFKKENDDIKFMKLLCDDVYMCLQTIDTKYGAMYSCSRQVSQGEQRSYSANQAPIPNFNQQYNDFHLNTSQLKRSCAYCFNDVGDDNDNDYINQNSHYVNNDNDENIDFEFYKEKILTEMRPLSFNIDDIKEYNEKYTVSEEIDDNPYSNLSILSLMRSCSSNVYDNKLFR